MSEQFYVAFTGSAGHDHYFGGWYLNATEQVKGAQWTVTSTVLDVKAGSKNAVDLSITTVNGKPYVVLPCALTAHIDFPKEDEDRYSNSQQMLRNATSAYYGSSYTAVSLVFDNSLFMIKPDGHLNGFRHYQFHLGNGICIVPSKEDIESVIGTADTAIAKAAKDVFDLRNNHVYGTLRRTSINMSSVLFDILTGEKPARFFEFESHWSVRGHEEGLRLFPTDVIQRERIIDYKTYSMLTIDRKRDSLHGIGFTVRNLWMTDYQSFVDLCNETGIRPVIIVALSSNENPHHFGFGVFETSAHDTLRLAVELPNDRAISVETIRNSIKLAIENLGTANRHTHVIAISCILKANMYSNVAINRIQIGCTMLMLMDKTIGQFYVDDKPVYGVIPVKRKNFPSCLHERSKKVVELANKHYDEKKRGMVALVGQHSLTPGSMMVAKALKRDNHYEVSDTLGYRFDRSESINLLEGDDFEFPVISVYCFQNILYPLKGKEPERQATLAEGETDEEYTPEYTGHVPVLTEPQKQERIDITIKTRDGIVKRISDEISNVPLEALLMVNEMFDDFKDK